MRLPGSTFKGFKRFKKGAIVFFYGRLTRKGGRLRKKIIKKTVSLGEVVRFLFFRFETLREVGGVRKE